MEESRGCPGSGVGPLCPHCGEKIYDAPHRCSTGQQGAGSGKQEDDGHPQGCRVLAGVAADALTADEVEP